MSPMPHDPCSAVPEGMRWCPHCNGYGSSLKEGAERCSRRDGSGLVAAAAQPAPKERGGAQGCDE